MNILLDRFPIDTCVELKTALEEDGHIVPLCILFHFDLARQVFKGNYYEDRNIAKGIATKDVPWVLSKSDLELAAKFEGLAVGSIARFDLNQSYFSAEEMSSHYFNLFNFWVYQVKKRKIDFCIHHYLPHEPSSFTLYVVLKIFKIPTIFIDVPHIFNKYRYLACSFKERGLLLHSNKKKSNFDYEKEFKTYKAHILNRNIYAIPQSVRYRHQKKENNQITKWLNFLKLFSSFLFNFKKFNFKQYSELKSRSLHYFKISRFSWSSKKNTYSNLYFNYTTKKNTLKLALSRKKYEAKCSPIPKGSYIYFAMPGQPEGTTLPVALSFREIFTVIHTLRAAIPEDISLVLKENPGVFDTHNPYLSFTNYRAPDFYDRLLSIPNLLLVSTSTDSLDLIQNSVITSTISGTAAIEAYAMGKPVITFASNWYDELDTIHNFESIKKLKCFVQESLEKKDEKQALEPQALPLDRKMMIKFDRHQYQFPENSRPEFINACKEAILRFKDLDSRKWEF